MFGISFSELLLIFIIALVVFGPEQLPIIARKAGHLLGSIKRLQNNLSEQLYQQSGLEQINQLKDELNSTVNQIKNSLNISNINNNLNEANERDVAMQELNFFYQPELDFDKQPELFDE